MYLRRLFLLCAASVVATAAVVGALLVWAVIVDWYPIVPAEGFSLERKVREVMVWTLTGALAGLGIGFFLFLLSLGWDVVRTRLGPRERNGRRL